MAITADDVIALENRFHDVVMLQKGTAAEQAAFFLHPDPWIVVPHGEDISLETNYEIHQQLTDEAHTTLEPVDITPLGSEPERARAVFAVLWEGRSVAAPDGSLIRCVVGEDWILQRLPRGDLRIVLYVNTYHRFLPESAPFTLG